MLSGYIRYYVSVKKKKKKIWIDHVFREYVVYSLFESLQFSFPLFFHYVYRFLWRFQFSFACYAKRRFSFTMFCARNWFDTSQKYFPCACLTFDRCVDESRGIKSKVQLDLTGVLLIQFERLFFAVKTHLYKCSSLTERQKPITQQSTTEKYF